MYTQILLDKKSIVDPLDASVFEMLREFIVREASVVAEKNTLSAVKAIKRSSDQQKWKELLAFLKRNNRLYLVDKLIRPLSSPYNIYLSGVSSASRALPDLDNMPIVDIINLVATSLRNELASEVAPIRLFHESTVRRVLLTLGSRTLIPTGTSAENIWLAYFSPFTSSSETIVLCDRYMLEKGNIDKLHVFLRRLNMTSYQGEVTLVTKYWFNHAESKPDHSRVESDAMKMQEMFRAHGLTGKLVFQDDRVLRGPAHGRHLRFGNYGFDLDIGVETFCSPAIEKDAKIVKWIFDYDRCRQEEKILRAHQIVSGKPAAFREFLLP